MAGRPFLFNLSPIGPTVVPQPTLLINLCATVDDDMRGGFAYGLAGRPRVTVLSNTDTVTTGEMLLVNGNLPIGIMTDSHGVPIGV